MLHDAREYLAGEFRNVQGWCIPQLWQTIQPIALLQRELQADGPVGEIGVYHGKFLIGLIKTKGSNPADLAIDVFDMQEFNLDGAGKGNLETFLGNLDKTGIPRAAVRIERADSMALTEERVIELRSGTGGFSMFSVDGCHLPEHTINDVSIAMKLTAPQGVIFVDDYTNADWPGVQEGIAKLYFTSCPRFVPLVCTSNKLVLAHVSYHARYLKAVADFVQKEHSLAKVKRVKRFGYETLTIIPNYQEENYIV